MNKKIEIRKSIFLRGKELMKGLITPQGSPFGFMPVSKDTEEWINTDRIYSLWKIGYCLGSFGKEALSGQTQVFFSLSKKHKLLIQLSSNGFMVCEKDGTNFVNGGVDLIELKNGLNVIWHRKLTCIGVDTFIAQVHSFLRDNQLLINGQIPFEEDVTIVEKCLLNVDEIFSISNMVGPYDTEASDEDILSLFDKPDLLSVVTTEWVKFVVLSSDKEKKSQELNSRIDELKKQGIDLSNIDEINLEKIFDLLFQKEV